MKMFPKILALFLGLGVGPILLIAIFFALPYHFQVAQYKNLIGLLLILSTVSTLCLAGLVTRLLKEPLNQLLHAQKEIGQGDLACRLSEHRTEEFQQLFAGFNKMAESIERAAERERCLVEERAFAKMASQIIHDLKSPLTSLKIAAEYFSSSNAEAGKRHDFENLLHMSTQRLEDIVAGLLQQRKKAAPTAVCLHTAVSELLAELKNQNIQSELEIQTEFCGSDLNFNGDVTEFKRAISNILTNAVEAMNQRGVLTLRTLRMENDAIIAIEDTGPGMSPDILQEVLKGGGHV